MAVTIFYYIFAVILFLGGVMGLVRAGSRASIVAGAGSAVVLIVAALLVPSAIGYALALLLSIVLLAYFGRSYLLKRRPMPAIPLVVLCLVSVFWTIAAWLR
jgi:uncharacterized membrane protein (UPF0136 family)